MRETQLFRVVASNIISPVDSICGKPTTLVIMGVVAAGYGV